MAAPLSVIIDGDLSVQEGCDTSQFGWGDLSVARIATILGTQEATNSNTGSLIVSGGLGLQKNAHLQSDLYVYDTTYLSTTFIDTTLGGVNISGGNAVTINVGAASEFTTTGGNLTLSATNNQTIISAGSDSSDAIRIETTSNSGGVYISGQDRVNIQSTNTENGIRIATDTAGVPVTIGTSTSVTCINGDLTVKGTTTTVESTVVTIEDNIIIVNNAPASTSDGGIGVKRYQPANNSSLGEVVLDSAMETGTVVASGNTVTAINLGTNASGTDDYYNGWWVKVTAGTGAGQVRRIKDYDGTTKIATIMGDSDQVNQEPIEGLDLLTVLDATSTFSLHECSYTFMLWDESNNEFAFTCSPNDPALEQPISNYANVHLANLSADNVNVTTINNVPADIVTTVTLTNNSITPVTITGFPETYGVYNVLVRPTSVSTSCFAAFTMSRTNSATSCGIVHRYTSSGGANSEKLDIQWGANVKPTLLFRPAPGVAGTTDFTIRITTV